ncbi:hypothetical protein [Klebsiella aerogenes]
MGIDACKAILPDVPMVGVFDTASTRQCLRAATCTPCSSK